MIPRDFHFEMGAYAYLFFLVPLILLLFYSARLRRSMGLQQLHLLDELVVHRDYVKSLFQEALFLFGFAFFVFALMQPVGFGGYKEGAAVQEKEYKSVKPVFFLLDTSLSMLVKDGVLRKNRFSVAKEIVDTTIDQLQGVPVGFKTFTSHLVNVSPVTYDSFYLRLLVRDTPINAGEEYGTNFLALFTELDQQLDYPAEIVLVSDGEDTSTYHASDKRKEERKNSIANKVDVLSKRGITVTTVGVGSENGGAVPGILYEDGQVISKPDFTLLEEIAARSESKFYDAKAWPVRELALHLATTLQTPKESDELERGPSTEVVYQPLYQYPLVFGVLCLLFALLIDCRQKRVSR